MYKRQLLAILGRSGALALGAGAAAMRWGIMAQTADVTTLALIEPLHGLTFALFHLGYMHHCGYCPEQPRRFGAGVLWDRRNWRCNGPVDHTFRLRTCRILGNDFTMLRSVSHHLEMHVALSQNLNRSTTTSS